MPKATDGPQRVLSVFLFPLGFAGPVTLDDSGDIDSLMCLLYVDLNTRKVCLIPDVTPE